MNNQINQNNLGFSNQEDDSIDIKGYLFKLISYWKWIGLSIILFLIIAFMANRYMTPLYPVKGTILINEEQTDMTGELLKELDFFSSSINIENEIGILKSYSLTRQVVDSLVLYVDYTKLGRVRDKSLNYALSPFHLTLLTEPDSLEQISFIVRSVSGNEFEVEHDEIENSTFSPDDIIQIEGISFQLTPNGESKLYGSESSYLVSVFNPKEYTRELIEEIKIKPINSESSILSISKETNNPETGQNIINTLMGCYIARDLSIKNATAISTVAFIDEQLYGVQRALIDAESQMESFRSDNSILNISEEGISIFSQLQELEKESAKLKMQLSYYEHLLDYLLDPNPSAGIVSPSTAGIIDPALNNLIMNLNDLSNQLILAEVSGSEINPTVKALKTQRQTTLRVIRENVKNLINTTEIQKQDKELQIREMERRLNSLPKSERQLVNIQRRFNLNDNLYVYLLEQKAEAGIAKASTKSSAVILDAAMSYEETQPKKLLNYILGLFFGFVIPLIVILINEYFTTSVQSPHEVEKNLNLSLLSTIPLSHHETDLVVENKPKSMVAEGFRTLRSNISYMMEKQNNQTIMFTSFTSGDGKTFNAINLSILMARSGFKTILLGLDLRKPKIFGSFGLTNDVGISNILIETKTLEEVLHHTSVKNLDFISAGPIPPNPNELILRPTFVELIEILKNVYDYIIIDSPPVGLVSDALEIAKISDINIFVIRHQQTPKKSLEYLESLQSKNIVKKLGVLYNGLDFKKSSAYGYGYGYGHEKGYGYYEET
ncbi:MAG: polysaccharide biosynthesis tyrosine autokinase [Cyclobacteriaceae bacterium]